MLIKAVRSSKVIHSTPQYIRKRCFKNFDSFKFKTAVRQIKWLEIYMSDNVNEAVNLFTHKILNILNDMAPMRKIQIRKRYNPWVSEETIGLIKLRNNAHITATESCIEEDWNTYKQLRNTINNRLKYEERNWQQNRLKQCTNDSRKCWKTIKSILNWKTSEAPSKLFWNGSMKTKSHEVAACQNEFFINKVEKLVKIYRLQHLILYLMWKSYCGVGQEP